MCSSAEHAAAQAGQPAPEAPSAPEDEMHQALERVLTAHETWFDVSRGYEYAGRHFDGYAEFSSHGESYVLVKRAKMWEVDNHEYIFFLLADALAEDELSSWVEFMKTEAINKVEPKPNHMSSCISLVILANSVSERARKLARRTRFRKTFKLSLQGWADLRLVLADLSTHRVYTNAAGKAMKATIEATIAPAQHKQER